MFKLQIAHQQLSAKFLKYAMAHQSYIPSHPALFAVDFSSTSRPCLTAQKRFAEGETICSLEGHSKGSDTYTTLQCGSKDRIKLRSDLAYVAHSCEPNVAFDLSSRDRSKWHVRALQNIEEGTPLTFFYPSTEWNLEMPFNCQCGARTCIGRVEGAKNLHREALMRRPHLNPWILFDEQYMFQAGRNCASRGHGAGVRGDPLCECKLVNSAL